MVFKMAEDVIKDNSISDDESGREYKYDAFISYRHAEHDQYVARSIHSKLENYKLPKRLRKLTGKKGINRVFRDNEELALTSNLEDYLVQALYDSKYLIVICSPSLNESKWCRKEIETFKNFHGSKNVFPILAEGTVEESFPEELLKDGDKDIEPLAADVTGGKRGFKKKIKTEIDRIVAPMFGVTYDDLKQRRKEASIKRKLMISFSITAVALVLGVVFAISAFTIKRQNELIRTEQAKSIARLAMEKMTNNDYVEGRKLAYESVTESGGIKMPTTAEGHKALCDSLGVYNSSWEYSPVSNYRMPGIIKLVKTSEDGKRVLIVDSVGNVQLADPLMFRKLTFTENFKDSVSFGGFDSLSNRIGFIGNDYMYVVKADDSLTIYDTKDGSVVKEFDDLSQVYSAYATGGRYLIIEGYTLSSILTTEFMIYDTETKAYVCQRDLEAFSMDGVATGDDYFAYRFLISTSTTSNDTDTDVFDEDTTADVDYEDTAADVDDDGIDDDNTDGGLTSNNNNIRYLVFHIESGEKIGTIDIQADNVYCEQLDEEGNLIVITSNLNDTEYKNDYYMSKYSVTNGSLQWSYKVPFKVEKAKVMADNNMLLWGGRQLAIIDMNNGSIYVEDMADATLVDAILYNEGRLAWFLLEDGRMCSISLDEDNPSLFDLSYMGIKVDASNISNAVLYRDMIYIVPKNEDMLVLYAKNENGDCYPYAGDIYAPNVEEYGTSLDQSEAIKEAEKYNVEDSSHVVKAIKNKEDGKAYFSRNDGTVDVYDMRSKKKEATFKVNDGDISYKGSDTSGNHYFACRDNLINHGYCTTADYEIIAEFESFIGLSSDRYRIIIDDIMAYAKEKAIGISYPIYTTKDLIRIAQERNIFSE